MSRINQPPISLARVTRFMKKPGRENCIAVIVGTVTDDSRIFEIPKLKVRYFRTQYFQLDCDLKVSTSELNNFQKVIFLKICNLYIICSIFFWNDVEIQSRIHYSDKNWQEYLVLNLFPQSFKRNFFKKFVSQLCKSYLFFLIKCQSKHQRNVSFDKLVIFCRYVR